MAKRRQHEWGEWVDVSLGAPDRETPEMTGTIGKIRKKIRKGINLVLLAQSLLVHAGFLTALGTAENCVQSSAVSAGLDVEDTGKDQGNAEAMEKQLKTLTDEFPDLANLPESQRMTLLGLVEQDKKILEQRQKELVQKVDQAKLRSFKDVLRRDLETGKRISFNEFVKQHEKLALIVDSALVDAQDGALDIYAKETRENRQKNGLMKTLQKIADLTWTPADDDPTIEQDILSVSAYKFLESREDTIKGRGNKVIGSCQAKAKVAIILLEKIFPEYIDRIFYIQESGHTYAAIAIGGHLYAINNGEVYKLKAEDRFGTSIYSPNRSIRSFAGGVTPEFVRCKLSAGQTCVPSEDEAKKGVRKTIDIPKGIDDGMEIPFDTENDGISDPVDRQNLLSRTDDISQLYPDFEEKHRQKVLAEIAKADSPVFYSSGVKTNYLDIGANREKWAERLESEVSKVLTDKYSGQLTLDFGDAGHYQAELLKKIFDKAKGIETDFIFTGLNDELLRAIAYSKINGKITLVFPNRKTLMDSRANILRLLELPHASGFEIQLALYSRAVPDGKLVPDIVDRLERNPARITIRSVTRLVSDAETAERIRNLAESQTIEIQTYEGSYKMDEKERTMYGLHSPVIRFDESDNDKLLENSIHRLSGHFAPLMTAWEMQRQFSADSSQDLFLHFRLADEKAFDQIVQPEKKGFRIHIDAETITPAEASSLARNPSMFLCLEGLTTLTPLLARELAKFKGSELSLPSLKEMTPQTARELVEFEGNYIEMGVSELTPSLAQQFTKFKSRVIKLPKVTDVTTETASALVKSRGTLRLDGLTVLTPEIARIFGESDLTSLSLRGITFLTPEVAHELFKFRGYLNLSGLRELPETLVREMLAFHGKGLDLSGVRTLSDDNVSLLARNFRAGSIALHGLEKISARNAGFIAWTMAEWSNTSKFDNLEVLNPETAKRIVEMSTKAETLSFPNLYELTPETARELVRFKGQGLCLNGLGELSRETARELVNYRGNLSLGNISQLAPEVAKELENYKGGILDLPGLTSLNTETLTLLIAKSGMISLPNLEDLTTEQAEILSRFSGKQIRLDGLTNLTADVARKLSAFQGEEIIFENLEYISPEVGKEFLKFKGLIWLGSLKVANEERIKLVYRNLEKYKKTGLNLPFLNHIDVPTARLLSDFGGQEIFLNGLSDITPEIAQALVQFRGDTLALNGLTSITPEIAAILSQFKGKKLGLHRLETLTPDSAKELAKFKGELIGLSGLKVLSPETARELKNFQGSEIYLNGMTDVSPSLCMELSHFQGSVHLSQRLFLKAKRLWRKAK